MTPTATYRLQFRNGMTFDRAIEIVPYLKRLGVSHLYASPIFTAAKGSTHGYDVTDHNEIDPTLGGQEGFGRLSDALREAGLGLILDIVPNHMAASLENRWWRSVVQWGAESPYARHFDIDWSRRLTLPILGRPFIDALAEGELKFVLEDEHGALALAYFDNLLPLHPSTWGEVVGGLDDPRAVALVRAARAAPEAGDEFNARVRRLFEEGDASPLQAALGALSADKQLIARIHDLQPWRLLHWKEARRDLSYRRFFEITGLVGVRVEEPSVFDGVHRLALDLVRSGQVDGLRIDHVDGLADPKAYLERLREEAGEDAYIIVEKILERDERLPPDWPVAGISGIEDPDAQRREAKRLMVSHNFEGERREIARTVATVAAELGAQAGEVELETALTELIVAFPVYRTYGNTDGMPQRDRGLLERIAAEVRTAGNVDADALDLLLKVLTGVVPPATADRAALVRARFQQLTGPVMAKAVEDTFFFRHNAFLALNEVGGDPLRMEGSVEGFHRAMEERARLQPHGLSATATHDTKRGEDARARHYSLSEAPEAWSGAVARWRGVNADAVRQLADGPAPEPETEWMLYQALAGVWPATEEAESQPRELSERLLTFVEKALREAKLRTSWTEINGDYEAAVKDYAETLLAPEFLRDFAATLRPFIKAGLINGVAQTLIKLTAPGIPDIYQGSEQLDFSLTDPDNRRPIDFGRLAQGLTSEFPVPVTSDVLSNGLFKQHLVARCLGLRRQYPALFGEGDYIPLDAMGARRKNVVAFARLHGRYKLVVIAPRLVLDLAGAQHPFAEAEAWQDTVVRLPREMKGRPWGEILTGRRVESGRQFALSSLLRDTPVALLSSMPV
jgi:(1->4)-alpha-D-glucan 1-alpha-D-glucosylmutase